MILSASRCKSFLDCSWQFFYSYFEKVPEKTHPKTKLGSLVHTILESLSLKKHRKNYENVIRGKSVYSDPGISRLISIYLRKNPDITSEISKDINALTFLALNHDFFFKDAKKELQPEFPFEIDCGEFQIKGFMDRVGIYDNIAVIRDFKTQGKKFSELEISDNLQSKFYQLGIKKILGIPARVEFIMLRHPKTPVQIVEPLGDDVLGGFEYFLAAVNQEINKLDKNTAKNNFKAEKDIGFCNYVCQLKKPTDYFVNLSEDGKIMRGAFLEKELDAKFKIEKRRYNGCFYFYNENGKPRNFQ